MTTPEAFPKHDVPHKPCIPLEVVKELIDRLQADIDADRQKNEALAHDNPHVPQVQACTHALQLYINGQRAALNALAVGLEAATSTRDDLPPGIDRTSL